MRKREVNRSIALRVRAREAIAAGISVSRFAKNENISYPHALQLYRQEEAEVSLRNRPDPDIIGPCPSGGFDWKKKK